MSNEKYDKKLAFLVLDSDILYLSDCQRLLWNTFSFHGKQFSYIPTCIFKIEVGHKFYKVTLHHLFKWYNFCSFDLLL